MSSALGGRPPSAEGAGKVGLPSRGGGFWRPRHGNSHTCLVHPLVSPPMSRGYRKESNLPLFLLHFPRAPITNNSGTPQSSLCELCLSLQLAFPGATVLRQRSRQLCWQRVSHAPVPVHDLCGLVPELYSGSLRASLSQLCQPLPSAAGSSASPFPPCHCWLRPWSRPVLSNRTFSSDISVHPVLSTVVAVSQLWPLSI